MTDNALDVAEIRGRYGRVAAALDDRLGGLTPDQWSAGTPCAQWDCRGLLTHVVDVHRRVGAMPTGAPPEPVTADTDLPAAWRAARDAVLTALADDATARTVVQTQVYGAMPFAEVVGGVLCADTLVHTWDLCRATGQDERLDPAAVTHAFALLSSLGEVIRRPGGLAPAVEPPAGADEQTRFLCFCGRAV
jgi:uncharacterized protein (TIGR03086 family)